MKKLSEDRLEWLARRQEQLQRRHGRLSGATRRRANLSKMNAKGVWRTSIISVPEHLLAERAEQRDQLRAKLDSAMRVLNQPKTIVRMDFTRTRKLYPGGTLLLLAYLEMLLQFFPGRIRARCRPNSLAAQLLRHFGIADMLGIDAAGSTPTHESVVNWRYLTGTTADGEKIAELLASFRDAGTVDPPEGLYDVLTEALTNVRHHAYPHDSKIPTDLRRWWLFARLNEPTNNAPGSLYIAIYDIGLGIQNSLKKQLRGAEVLVDQTDELFSLLGMGESRRLEQVLLKRAVEHKRSSTGLAFRGHGLPEMRDFVMQTSTGRLYIISGAAQYSCSPAESVSNSVACNHAFPGTLLLWSIPIGRKEVTV